MVFPSCHTFVACRSPSFAHQPSVLSCITASGAWTFPRALSHDSLAFRYLQQNILSDLVGLELLPGLRMLNISHNSISNLAGLQHCTTLSTLICSRNSLTSYDSINALSYCKELSTVDLQDNKLGSDAVSPTGAVPAPPRMILHFIFTFYILSAEDTRFLPVSLPVYQTYCLRTLHRAGCMCPRPASDLHMVMLQQTPSACCTTHHPVAVQTWKLLSCLHGEAANLF